MLEIVILVLVLIFLWLFSKTVKQFTQLAEGRATTFVSEAVQSDMKRRAKLHFDTDTMLKAAENTQLAMMALEQAPELLDTLRRRTQEPTA